MALVLSPWFGRACGRRRTRLKFGSPSLFTDLVILKVPLQRQTCAPVGSPAMSSARIVQWTETPEAHVFKLRLPGLKKDDLHIQVEDDRTLYISHGNQPKEESREGGAKQEESDTNSQMKEQPSSSCSFMRKFKLPENADLEQIKADVTNETLTVTVPKRKTKSPEVRKILVSESGVATPNEGKAAEQTSASPTKAAEQTSASPTKAAEQTSASPTKAAEQTSASPTKASTSTA